MTGETLREAENFFTSQERTPVTFTIKYLLDYKFCSKFQNDESAKNHMDIVHRQVVLKLLLSFNRDWF